MHKTTGFSLYQMLYGRPMRKPLDQTVRYWRGKEEQGQNTTIELVETLKANMQVVRDFVETLNANMQVVRDLAYEKEIKEKESPKFYHNMKSVVRNFNVGEYVLVFRPGMGKLFSPSATWDPGWSPEGRIKKTKFTR